MFSILRTVWLPHAHAPILKMVSNEQLSCIFVYIMTPIFPNWNDSERHMASLVRISDLQHSIKTQSWAFHFHFINWLVNQIDCCFWREMMKLFIRMFLRIGQFWRNNSLSNWILRSKRTEIASRKFPVLPLIWFALIELTIIVYFCTWFSWALDFKVVGLIDSSCCCKDERIFVTRS